MDACQQASPSEDLQTVEATLPSQPETLVHVSVACYAGRAGNEGTAITFIGPDEEKYAPDLIKALKESSAAVPKDLADMAAAFSAKCKAGTAQIHGSGYGGSGFKFDSVEDDAQKANRQVSAVPGWCSDASACLCQLCNLGLRSHLCHRRPDHDRVSAVHQCACRSSAASFAYKLRAAVIECSSCFAGCCKTGCQGRWSGRGGL